MNKNLYANFILTIFLIVFLAFTYIQTRNIDLMRLRMEKVSEDMQSIQREMHQTNLLLQNLIQKQPIVKDYNVEKNQSSPIIPFAKFANSEFYDPQAVAGGGMITAVMSETKNMNALVNNEAFVSSIWSYVNDSLSERNYEHPEKFEPKLAESWEISEDKLSYTIHIRKGVLWHDFIDPVTGKKWENVEVTADDFKFYLDVVKNPDVDCAPIRTYLQDIDRIEVLDKYTFKVFWKKKYFLSESITLGLEPLPRHFYHAYEGPFDGKKFNDDHERNRIMVGCGPYKFAQWDKGAKIILKRWEKYYAGNLGYSPPLEQLSFEIIKHPMTQLQALHSGQIDRMSFTPDMWINNTNTEDFDEKTGKLKKYKYPSMSYSYIGYNMRMPIFSDRRVRTALTHLVNREKILKDVYHDLARICTGPFFMDSVYNDKNIKPLEFSPEKAKKLLEEAGWVDSDNDGILDKNGKKFEFTILSVADHPIQSKMLPIIKEDMAAAGIVMKISPIEWSVYVQRLENKNFEVCILGWAMGFENDPYQLWHSAESEKPASSNHCGFVNKEADKLIMEIRECFDLNERIKLCHKFHAIIHEEQPYTFLFSPYNLVGMNGKYRNVRVFPSGIPTNIIWDGSIVR
ncbi:MAG TPA: ABC transporter substrate-binding protein [Victivallales bacterium]|nr:ABC transporter substrate-binding protein [Victivallales bacterium]HRR29247.1 ABC transporter substrate-binding protein [Victivallales bacterium]HRU00973.1 ABC transporter substrate-binding protein [Victivallales bacterium]